MLQDIWNCVVNLCAYRGAVLCTATSTGVSLFSGVVEVKNPNSLAITRVQHTHMYVPVHHTINPLLWDPMPIDRNNDSFGVIKSTVYDQRDRPAVKGRVIMPSCCIGVPFLALQVGRQSVSWPNRVLLYCNRCRIVNFSPPKSQEGQ